MEKDRQKGDFQEAEFPLHSARKQVSKQGPYLPEINN